MQIDADAAATMTDDSIMSGTGTVCTYTFGQLDNDSKLHQEVIYCSRTVLYFKRL